ncbi:hypothetical protein DY023_16220 [Microbacterium bovistercoris]|uniref:DUF3618 domain-containing protein n=1 Tax=Microbacterium bovistercoris TaxID=2293570 RepID=A0A371NQB8_9MICO|nr:hypothetical protein [Microbacterium bovistercoris]REJ03869.1 hypothetical protein DY023_16220 [Microbacterium bovistercoris]
MTNSDQTPLPRTAVAYGITDPVASARAELKAALAAIEVKANVPRRVEQASQRGIAKARVFAKKNPVGAVAAVIGVAVTVGGIVWVIARAASR